MSGKAFAKYGRDLLRAAAGMDSVADKAAYKAAKGAAATAESVAPKQTGALRDSIQVVRGKDGRATVQTDLYYAMFQEYGTTRMAPNPFIGPAVDKWRPRLADELGRAADDVLGGL